MVGVEVEVDDWAFGVAACFLVPKLHLQTQAIPEAEPPTDRD